MAQVLLITSRSLELAGVRVLLGCLRGVEMSLSITQVAVAHACLM